MMHSTRDYLPAGTRIRLESGGVYEITGDPIGLGGGSMIYPVDRLLLTQNGLQRDGMTFALKECYPQTMEHRFSRTESGEIVSEAGDSAGNAYLDRVKQLLLDERKVTQYIYRTGSRLLPVLEASATARIKLPDREEHVVNNVYTVMESLSSKGRSLHAYLEEYHTLPVRQAFHIIEQTLFALREIHSAGYLHLDIQDGNIFIRGALEDESDLVTMIDFGSARAMLEGKTEPISDKVIFTTEGFSAPEILLHNDGSLRLGREADLYSVGCLILYLLTGSRPDTTALLNNTGGKYLTRFQLRKIDCPKHLVERMQAIIARALEQEPEKRYHSAEEMLSDVSSFVKALQPYRDNLADTAYDAFICYRHGPVDSAAAKELQERLEHLRVPASVSGGEHRGIRRVFVDEGELSSCADFAQQIREALKNARWLIVVCSPGTADSPWVNLEIETFLEYHDRSHILAVLTGGEPETAFPHELRGSDGKNEVLAADARGGTASDVRKKLRHNALLKIAAPMLDTTFDSLKQRRRIYTLQRLSAAAVILLAIVSGFLAYSIRQANRIRAQSEEIAAQSEEIRTQSIRIKSQADEITAQAEQLIAETRNTLTSRALRSVEQANGFLEQGDRLAALQAAIDAVPEFQGEPLLVPGAEYALTRATGVYDSPYAEGSIFPVRTIPMESVRRFGARDGTLILETQDPALQLINANTMQTERLIDIDGSPLRTVFYPEKEQIVLVFPHRAICVDYANSRTLWVHDANDSFVSAIVSEDRSLCVLLEESELLLAETGTGNILQQVPVLLEDGQRISGFAAAVSANREWAAFSVYDSRDGTSGYTMAICDVRHKLVSILPLRKANLVNAFISEQNRLIVSTDSNNGTMYRTVPGEHLYFEQQAELLCVDCETGTMLWENSFLYGADTQYTLFRPSGLVRVSYPVDGQTVRALLYYHGNEVIVFEPDSGTALQTYRMASHVVNCLPTDDGFYAITYNGELVTVSYGEEEWGHPYWTAVSFIPDSIAAAVWDGDYFYVRTVDMSSSSFTDEQVIQYRFRNSVSAFDYETLCAGSVDTQQYEWTAPLYRDEFTILWNAPDRFTYHCDRSVLYADLEGGSLREYVLPNTEAMHYCAIGVLPDRGTAILFGEGADPLHRTYEIAALSLRSGSVVTRKIVPPEAEGRRFIEIESVSCCDGRIFCFTSETTADDAHAVCVYLLDPDSGMLRPLGDDGALPPAAGIYPEVYIAASPDEERVLMCSFASGAEARFVCAADFKSGRFRNLSAEELGVSEAQTTIIRESQPIVWSPSGQYALYICGNKVVLLEGRSFAVLDTITVEDGILDFATSISTAWFSEDENTAFLYYYSDLTNQTGSVLSLDLTARQFRSNTSLHSTGVFSSTMALPLSGDVPAVVLLSKYNTRCAVLRIGGETPEIAAVLDDCLSYDAQNDRFITIHTDEGHVAIGTIPRYSVSDLLQRAKAILGEG